MINWHYEIKALKNRYFEPKRKQKAILWFKSNPFSFKTSLEKVLKQV